MRHSSCAAPAKHDLGELRPRPRPPRGRRAAARRSARRGCDPRSAAAAGTAGPAPCCTPSAPSVSASAGADAAQRRRPGRSVERSCGAVASRAALSSDRGCTSTSTAAPRGSAATPTAARAGYGSAEVLRHDSLTSAKCARSVRNTVSLTTWARSPPAAAATALQVVEHAADLRLDVAADHLAGRRVERDLARQVHRVAGADGLRVGADGLRSVGGRDGERHGRSVVVVADSVR